MPRRSTSRSPPSWSGSRLLAPTRQGVVSAPGHGQEDVGVTRLVEGAPARQVAAGELAADVGHRERQLTTLERPSIGGHALSAITVDTDAERVAPSRRPG